MATGQLLGGNSYGTVWPPPVRQQPIHGHGSTFRGGGGVWQIPVSIKGSPLSFGVGGQPIHGHGSTFRGGGHPLWP
jgi:hypothetical protein